jgi:hypothetical protein
MAEVLQDLGKEEEAQMTKRLAQTIRKEILGIDPGDDDCLESYDKLVGYIDK